MSADGAGAIGPVSVRYAAQIRELLHAQALQRMAAAEEAARASVQAERAARIEPSEKAEEPEPVKAKAKPAAAAQPQAEPAKTEKADPAPVGRFVDIQA